MSSKPCSCCKEEYDFELPKCPFCGIPDLSQMDWISNDRKEEFVRIRKPIKPVLKLEEVKELAEKAANQCDFQLNSLSIQEMDNALFDTLIDPNDFHNITINCNTKGLRCYANDELLALLKQQIMFAKSYNESAPFTPIPGAAQQNIDFRLQLKLAYDSFINYKEYVKMFPNDTNFHSAKRFSFSNLSLEFLTTKFIFNSNGNPSFLQPLIKALDMYQDAALYFFEKKNDLSKWIELESCDALFTLWKWFHEDFKFINQYASERGETEKLLQLTEFLSANIFGFDIFINNKLSFLATFRENMKTCENYTTNPIGKSIIKSWKTRLDNSDIYETR